MKRFCEFVRVHSIKIIDFKKTDISGMGHFLWNKTFALKCDD